MNITTKIQSAALAGALTLAAFGVCSPAQAGSPTDDAAPQTQLVTSKYDLHTDAGVNALKAQARRQSADMCNIDNGNFSFQSEEQACYRKAIANANAQIDAMTAEIRSNSGTTTTVAHAPSTLNATR
jgi:UrcA family protein